MTTIGLVGRKCGMTRIFTEDGVAVPVTVIEITPNRITQVKTKAKDGYDAIQVTTGSRSKKHVSKPKAGHFAKAGVEAGEGLWEFRIDSSALGQDAYAVGAEIKVDLFEVGQKVDVSGITKGKGFAGVMKRWNFGGGDASHGNSLSHRHPGSIGQRQTPGRVFKGKKMAGHMGVVKRTAMSQVVVRVDVERNLLLVKGAVPGAPSGRIIVMPAIKAPKKKEAEKK